LIVIAWVALFHALFYQKGINPWHVVTTKGGARRYQYVDGEPRHWELAQCIVEYFGGHHPPERKNLEFLIGLRNKIEHRDLPELDPALYGECQAALLNLEHLLTQEFGPEAALEESLAVALQFSHAVPEARAKAIKRLASTQVADVLDYIQAFRAGLPAETLESQAYSFSVYLVPKAANRVSAADLSVEFVPFDPAKPEEAEKLRQIVAVVKERRVPVANANLLRPSEVVRLVNSRVPYEFTMDMHTRAWQAFGVRPRAGAGNSQETETQYCVYDRAHGDYLYTQAWVDRLATELATEDLQRDKLRRG
jgi:hypothetical protein